MNEIFCKNSIINIGHRKDIKKNSDSLSKVCINSDCDREKIASLFTLYNNDRICENYNKKEIENMYFIIYDSKPLSNSTKMDITSNIRQYFNALCRTDRVIKSLKK